MRLLVTGSSGRVGSELCPRLAEWFDLRLLDIRSVDNPPGEFIEGSIADKRVLKRAMKGVDAVVHMVMANDSAPKKTFERSCWTLHVKTVRGVLEATEAAGIERLVYTSTLSLYDTAPQDVTKPISEKTPPKMDGTYAVTKYLGEEIVRLYSIDHPVSAVSLRLTGPIGQNRWDELAEQRTSHPWVFTHMDDVAEAYRLAVSHPTDTFEAFHIAPDVNPSRYDITKAKKVLGYTSKHPGV